MGLVGQTHSTQETTFILVGLGERYFYGKREKKNQTEGGEKFFHGLVFTVGHIDFFIVFITLFYRFTVFIEILKETMFFSIFEINSDF